MTPPSVKWVAPSSYDACEGIASMWDVTDGEKMYRVTERRNRREGTADEFVVTCSCGKWNCDHMRLCLGSRPDPDRHPRSAA